MFCLRLIYNDEEYMENKINPFTVITLHNRNLQVDRKESNNEFTFPEKRFNTDH